MSDPPETPLTPAELKELRHELRTPFNAIIGYTEMLQESAEDEGHQALVEGLARLLAGARELLALVNAALATGMVVRAGELARLGAQVKVRLDPLLVQIEQMLEQARQGGLVVALPDLARVRDAGRNLAALVDDQLLCLGRAEPGHVGSAPGETVDSPKPAETGEIGRAHV